MAASLTAAAEVILKDVGQITTMVPEHNKT